MGVSNVAAGPVKLSSPSSSSSSSSPSSSSSTSSDHPNQHLILNQNQNLNDLSKLHAAFLNQQQQQQLQQNHTGEILTNGSSGGAVEIGIVEKMFNGYGFIKCNHRDQLLFFNQPYYYQGPVNGLKPGDIVEFDPVIDKRTGKVVATNIIKHQDKLNQKRLQQQYHQQKQQQHNYSILPVSNDAQTNKSVDVAADSSNDVANINLTNLKVCIFSKNKKEILI